MPANDWTITAYFTFLAALTGAAGGSFMNCLSWRLARGESVAKGRSRCVFCGHVLGIADLVPVLSWVLLRGRCRYCGRKISCRYVYTELFMAAASTALLLRYGLTPATPFYQVYSFILLGIGLMDWETFEIPDGFHAAAILWWTAGLLMGNGPVVPHIIKGLAGGFAIAGPILCISLVCDRILGRDSLGGGDIKLFFVTGLYLGFAVNLLNVIVSCILALILAGLTAKRRKTAEDPAAIPFGPAISLSALLCLIWGEQAVGLYMRFFGL